MLINQLFMLYPCIRIINYIGKLSSTLTPLRQKVINNYSPDRFCHPQFVAVKKLSLQLQS